MIKTKQIEDAIRGIRNVGRGKEEQEARIRELEGVMQGVVGEREQVERERREWVRRVEEMICAVRR